MKIKIEREEISFVIKWSIFILFLSSIPYIYAYLSAPSYKSFIGIPSCNSSDFNTYLAWMHQAKEGHFLFKDQYTTEPHKRIFFHPLFLLLGIISKYTHLSLITITQLSRLVFGFFLLITSYIFVSYFVYDKYLRRIAFLLITVSSGVGCYLILFKIITPEVMLRTEDLPIDLWVPEAITFWTIYGMYLFSISVTLILFIFLFFLHSYNARNLKYSFYAAILTLFLGFIHTYDLFIVYPILFIAGIFYSIKDKKPFFIFTSLFIIFFISSLSPLYSYLCLKINPIFKTWSDTPRLSPSFINYVLGFGLLFLLSAISAIRIIILKREIFYFPLIWIMCAFFLVYLPVSFQRRLIEGVHIPLCILSADSLFWIVCLIKEKFTNFDYKKAVRIIIILTSFSNMGVMATEYKTFKMHLYPYYLPNEVCEAFSFIEKNCKENDVIFSLYSIGNFIPARSSCRVFFGHYDQTLHAKEKRKIVKKFFNEKTKDEWRRDILKKHKINYVLQIRKKLYPASGYFYASQIHLDDPPGKFNPENAKYLTKVFQNEFVGIYKVK